MLFQIIAYSLYPEKNANIEIMPDDRADIAVIAVDPGTHKCGVALLTADGEAALRDIIQRKKIVENVGAWLEQNPGAAVVVGGLTQGGEVARELFDSAGIKAVLVDEAHTTERARELFWRENRPGCFWGIFPPSFRPLPRPIDDYAAVIIGRRFLSNRHRKQD